jgi:hypothetical protein
MVPELELLVHSINKSDTTPTPQHVQVIKEYPPPQDVKQLQRYLDGQWDGQLLPLFHTRYCSSPGAAPTHVRAVLQQ